MLQKIRVKEWRNRTKLNLIDALGGKCCRCGYSLCKKALHFHHLDPSTKKDTVAEMISNPQKIAKIVEEAKKCILLCAICHVELHDNLWDLSSIIIPVFDDSKINIHPPKKKEYTCQHCGKPTFNYYYCSRKCTGLAGGRGKYKIDWPPIEELLSLIKIKPVTRIAEELGVSDNAVRKHLKVRGFKL